MRGVLAMLFVLSEVNALSYLAMNLVLRVLAVLIMDSGIKGVEVGDDWVLYLLGASALRFVLSMWVFFFIFKLLLLL